MGWLLTSEQLSAVQAARRATREKKALARLSALVMLESGYTYADVALALDIHPDTVGQWKQRYLADGLASYLHDDHAGSSAYLTPQQQRAVAEQVLAQPAITAREVGAWIATTYHVAYGLSSVRALLRRLDFVNVRQRSVPGRASAAAQRACIAAFAQRQQAAAAQPAETRPVFCFADGVHPRHQSPPTRVRGKRGTQATAALVPANTGRQRLNLNGAIRADAPQRAVIQPAETINAQDTIRLFEKLLAQEPQAERVVVSCDNARYYRCRLVGEWLNDHPRPEQWFLPAYAPNLNLIERFRGRLHQQVLAGTYYATFADFQAAVMGFFDPTHLATIADELRRLLNPKFQVLQSPLVPA